MSEIRFEVLGIPKPQGSKRLVRTKRGRTLMLEANAGTMPWRDSVAWSARAAMRQAKRTGWLVGPLAVDVEFRFPRPKRYKHPVYVVTRPDADKLLRAFCDALTGSLWTDDSQVVSITARKVYASPEATAGLLARVSELTALTQEPGKDTAA